MRRQRNTRQRKSVLDIIQTRRDHLSAEQIYRSAREVDPNISRGTVYRNLNLLVKNGEIRHVRLPGVDRFDWRQERHYHLLCTGCGKVCDVPMPYHAGLDRDIAEKTGYQVELHRTVFEGLCPDCCETERASRKEPGKSEASHEKDSG
jgi:Fe2+ or Zn2+ uptake regulation protein